MKPSGTAYFGIVFISLALAVSSLRAQENRAQLGLDHIVIFSNDNSVIDSLKQHILTLGTKLSTRHLNQGTFGKYFIFYNSYIEFLSLEDSVRAKENEKRFKSKYTERWNGRNNTCPFGFGLSLNPFDTTKTDFPLVPYKSLDSPAGEYYLMSEYNVQSAQPLIYISTPQNVYTQFDSLGQVDEIIDEYAREDFKNYLSHPSEIKELTQVILTLPEGVQGGNVQALQNLKSIEIVRGEKYGITLVFDDARQGREVVLSRKNYLLILKY